ncbi:hypothetical protein A3C91_04845 [Candidatus Azambacteria bacterium RIFCSPHIGHO2_02_FULL_52_12]|uniref:Ada DNA repair metal-binding domain-containing protein n=1 Tax=Candidatus Azambacteria bacterium RIFCSPLOWO2_01_FULL_46_25 TaxID=1797298 RepID=A0A1F5BVU3_9BACT|nr:MAG: hypothetical protein A3C91_04845 [Candidatus Azambacteria bacterium RIFCSPHIGHO2_02_FULL_52_12]OGD34721.1 MAG: hypothetical protein A2988_04460 [Candidatus Azambacteria bacterium RIFCSPLOWO2_01_FULL_46_25]OGD37006.1 MAG: hypothetical protein A2850_03755 [Candidatus Azambacteria bacterium RIFCSPHIGHO2_01_FULL_51_74]
MSISENNDNTTKITSRIARRFSSEGSIGFRIVSWCKEQADFLLHIGQLSLVAALFFGIGMLFAQHFLFPKESFTIRESQKGFPALMQANILGAVPPQPARNTVGAGTYVASRNGKNYYKLSCRNTIKETNKVYFTSEEDAKKAGYAPSASCFK